MAREPPSRPLVVIIGATGTGKSQLAVQLAKRFNGEIINADAMQLYAGLPIITNKITLKEQQGVPHHLLGCIGLHDPTWVVGKFVREALRTIDEVRRRGRLPIVVGGTHYYVQSLLFRDSLAEGDQTAPVESAANGEDATLPFLDQPTEILLEELERVDPAMSQRWHPNDRRKIRRSLEIYLRTGRKASELYSEQRHDEIVQSTAKPYVESASPSGVQGTRFPTLLFWIHAEPDVLRDRLDRRVDKMLEEGLLKEVNILSAFASAEAAGGRPVDETRGIWVSIGYKEFKAYVQGLDMDEVEGKLLMRLKDEGSERMRIATRQYAKRQLRWIRIKLINALISRNAMQSLYLLDGSDVSSSDQLVSQPALKITQRFLEAAPMPDPAAMSAAAAEMLTESREYDLAAAPETWSKQYCEACDTTCVTPATWHQHLKSKSHQRTARRGVGYTDCNAVDIDSGART